MSAPEPKRFWWGADFRCLSHALTRSILRMGIPAILPIPEEVRKLAAVDGVSPAEVRGVAIHQCPKGSGLVAYKVHLQATNGRWWESEFEYRGDATHGDFLLYDRDRDGAVDHVHLLH